MNKRICVVGAGYWGKNHINTLDRLKSLGGIVDSNPSTLEFFSNKFKNVSLYSNLDESFNDNFDGYIVSSPAKTHYQLARKIILNKKPILIEKPLTLRIDESEELLRLSKDCEVFAMVGHVLLFHPAIIKIKQLIKSKAIGKLQYLYSNRLNLGKVRTEENVFWSLAPWKTITLSNETIADQEITIDEFNVYLKNVVNQQGRPLFPSDTSAIEIYPYENSDLSCVINFRYQGYTESELADNNDLSFVDISTAVINIGDTSYNYNLSKEVYLDLSSNLFEYLNINQYTNTYNDKKVIELPIDTDVSINFIFKQSKTNKKIVEKK